MIRKRFLHIAKDLDINIYKYEEEKKIFENLKKDIKNLNDYERKIRRKRNMKKTASDLQNEINSYLMKASKPENDFEKMLLEKILRELGEITSVRDLSEFLKFNKNDIYKAVDNGEIMHFKRGRRIYIITEGTLPFLREK